MQVLVIAGSQNPVSYFISSICIVHVMMKISRDIPCATHVYGKILIYHQLKVFLLGGWESKQHK